MARVLLTGGTGTLGRALVPGLAQAGFTVRVMSRSARPLDAVGQTEWATADLGTGAGLAEAVVGVDVIVNAATGGENPQAVDVEGASRLCAAGLSEGVGHLVHVSIVGIDRNPLPYYRAKLAAEQSVERSGAPSTILRATQFHELMEQWFLRRLVQGRRICLLPSGYRFQLIDVREVAGRIVEIVRGEPLGRAVDIGGPELLTLHEIARSWCRASGRRALLVDWPKPGAVAAAYRAGYAMTPDNRYGTVTWEQWLAERYGRGGVAELPGRSPGHADLTP